MFVTPSKHIFRRPGQLPYPGPTGLRSQPLSLCGAGHSRAAAVVRSFVRRGAPEGSPPRRQASYATRCISRCPRCGSQMALNGTRVWRISKVRLEQAQRVRRDHESARAGSGDQHGSNQNPHNFALGHRDNSPNPSLSILSPSYFCCGRCRLKIPGRPCGPCHAMRQAQQGPDLQQERPSHATGWERG